MVKADGFGHGAVAVARTALANGATRLGVTSARRGVRAARRRASTRRSSAGSTRSTPTSRAAVDADVDLAVPSREHLDAIARARAGARVHLHLDTGMARDGAEPRRWADAVPRPRAAERQGPSASSA